MISTIDILWTHSSPLEVIIKKFFVKSMKMLIAPWEYLLYPYL